MNSQALRGLSPFTLLFSVLLLLTLPNLSYSQDTDGDGFLDTIGADIDGDGIPNAIEDLYGLNPLLLADGALDLDDDGWSNADEYRFGTGIDNATTNPANLNGDRAEKVFAADGAAFDAFGYSVSVSGDTAVIGANEDDNEKGNDAGSAYVFTRSGGVWSQQQKLSASDGVAGDLFGTSVSVFGDTALIGAGGDENSTGSAYVFVRSGVAWSQQQKLTDDIDGAAGDNFSRSVSVFGDKAVIGAYADDGNTGSAYVFTRSGQVWSQQQKLIATDGATNERFGWSVSVSGDTVVIGATADFDASLFSGSAYFISGSIHSDGFEN